MSVTNAMVNKSLNIVCISPAPWDYPVWTNRQHIMKRLSGEHRIIYVFHPVFFKSSLKRFLQVPRFSMLKPAGNNLFIFTPLVLPLSESIPLIRAFNIWLSCFFLKKIMDKKCFQEYITWFYDPEAVGYLDYLRPLLSCYDCVDEFSAMPSYKNPKRKAYLIEQETRLIKKSSVVFTTSHNLLTSKKKLNPNTFLVENVGDFDHFNKPPIVESAPQDIPQGNTPIIGFAGAVDPYKVDFKIISYLAQKRPEWRIILIGGVTDSQKSGFKFPVEGNITYLGHKEYYQLPSYLHLFDVLIIPYVINEYTQGVFPIKVFEYLATGKPVVTTSLPSLKIYSSVLKISESKETFLQNIENALTDDREAEKKKRIECAKANTWERRAARLTEYLYRQLGR